MHFTSPYLGQTLTKFIPYKHLQIYSYKFIPYKFIPYKHLQQNTYKHLQNLFPLLGPNTFKKITKYCRRQCTLLPPTWAKHLQNLTPKRKILNVFWT